MDPFCHNDLLLARIRCSGGLLRSSETIVIPVVYKSRNCATDLPVRAGLGSPIQNWVTYESVAVLYSNAVFQVSPERLRIARTAFADSPSTQPLAVLEPPGMSPSVCPCNGLDFYWTYHRHPGIGTINLTRMMRTSPADAADWRACE